jgi:hypothetical protein
MIDVIHGALERGAGILQPKGHDHVFEQSHDTGYSECSLVYVLWGHENLIVAGVAIHELRILLPAATLINVSATGIGYSSFGVALLRSLKSTQARHRPSFFCMGTMLEIHSTYLYDLMNPTSSIFSISFLTSSKTSVLI